MEKISKAENLAINKKVDSLSKENESLRAELQNISHTPAPRPQVTVISPTAPQPVVNPPPVSVESPRATHIVSPEIRLRFPEMVSELEKPEGAAACLLLQHMIEESKGQNRAGSSEAPNLPPEFGIPAMVGSSNARQHLRDPVFGTEN